MSASQQELEALLEGRIGKARLAVAAASMIDEILGGMDDLCHICFMDFDLLSLRKKWRLVLSGADMLAWTMNKLNAWINARGSLLMPEFVRPSLDGMPDDMSWRVLPCEPLGQGAFGVALHAELRIG